MNNSHLDTSNDEIIARAIAQDDQEDAQAEAIRRNTPTTTPSATPRGSTGMHDYPGLRRNNFTGERIPGIRHSVPQASTDGSAVGSNIEGLIPMLSRRVRARMCHVPCHLQDVCVEMMVDTGAEVSVISGDLAKQLNLSNQIDRQEWGIAAGVGTARIIGKIHNVICTLGDVDFAMDFTVLDVPGNKMLIMGMDQMRKYNCIIDLQRDVLIFGGNGGVEVKMLTPPPEQQLQPSHESCSIS